MELRWGFFHDEVTKSRLYACVKGIWQAPLPAPASRFHSALKGVQWTALTNWDFPL